MAYLTRDPEATVVCLSELVGVAHAIETEAVRRYEWLATEMARRGEDETAEAFRALAAEEGRHIDAVTRWGESLGEALPPTGSFAWHLPPDMAQSWEEAADSTLLTPYRALAIAVDNEQRAFAFFSYLAARAENPKVAAEAEVLAREELRHAALLRIWRRAAWRRQREGGPPTGIPHRVEGMEQLLELIAEHERSIAHSHRALAQRLAKFSNTAGSALLTELADLADARAGPGNDKVGPVDLEKVETPVAALRTALKPLERFAEILEVLLIAPPDEATQAEAQEVLADIVARIARIGQCIEALEST